MQICRSIFPPILLLLAWLLPVKAWAADHAVILLYHHVASDTPPITSVTPEQFGRHLDYLQAHGFHVLPLAELVEKLTHGQPVPEKSVAITFDDAYRSVFSEAVPMLAKHHWPFTVFVSTDYIDHHYGNYMSWAQLRQLQALGGSIGDHSLSHPHMLRRLPGESEQAWQVRARHQIEGAEKRLQQELGVSAKMFAYPYGEFDPELQALVAKLGYYGFGQQSGAVGFDSDPTAIARFPLMGRYDDMKDFALRVTTRPLPVTLVDEKRTLLPADVRQPRLTIQLGKGGFSNKGVRCYFEGAPMPMQWLDRKAGIFAIESTQPLPAGRSKYTCTAPARDGHGVYYWYSHPWIIPRPDGSWPRG